jgi:hypothetical protein
MPNGFTSSAIDYGDFYRGSMQPPVIANGLPTQSAVGTRVERVTPEGLNVNRVQTVAVDPFTGNPIQAGGSSGGNVNTRAALAAMADPRNANDVVRSIPATGSAHSPQPTIINAVDPLDANRLGLTATARTPAPIQAIEAATTMRPSMRLGSFFANGALPFLAGDPGVPTNVTADNGMFGIPAQGFATIPNGPPTVPTVRSVIAARAAAQPPATMASNLNPGVTRFLSEQGVSSKNMSAGEQANALKKAMGIGGP